MIERLLVLKITSKFSVQLSADKTAFVNELLGGKIKKRLCKWLNNNLVADASNKIYKMTVKGKIKIHSLF